MSLYSCHSCMDNIPLHKPRVQCTNCKFYNICASCYVLSTYTDPHTSAHRVVLVEKSGLIQTPPPPPPRPPLPARPSNSSNASQTSSYVPTHQTVENASQQTFLRASHSAQPQSPPPMSESTVRAAVASHASVQATSSDGNSRSDGWMPLFLGCAPSKLGNQLLNTLFDCLDTQKIGSITPEQYSAFLDVQGYSTEENLWKRTNKPQIGYSGEDLADFEFRTILENFSFEFTLRPRPAAPNRDIQNMMGGIPGLTDAFSKILASSASLTPLSGGQMPCLTRKGFVDICTLEMLADPSLGWRYINLALKHYHIWRQWGDYPRSMLPEEAPKQVLDRITKVTALGQRRANERLEAARIQTEIEKRGRENALRLLDPPGTTYHYRY